MRKFEFVKIQALILSLAIILGLIVLFAERGATGVQFRSDSGATGIQIAKNIYGRDGSDIRDT